MGLKRYNVTIPGKRNDVVATLLLSDEDAKAQGLTEKDLAGKAAPANKAATPAGTKRGARKAATPAGTTEPAATNDDGEPAGDTPAAE